MKKPKIVYVLVSDPADHFTEMAILSIYCARQYSPLCDLEIVMDRQTYEGLSGYRSSIINMVDYYKVVDVNADNNAFKSRYIKTKLRELVEDDFLYVDIDAVPVNELSDIFKKQADIAMAYDYNVSPKKFILHDFERVSYDKNNWPLPTEFFNSGVMLTRDNSNVRKLFSSWHELWHENQKQGLHKDQPPLHEAIRKNSIKLEVLEPEWNMMIGLQTGVGAKNPKVYHYSTVRFETRDDTYFHEIVRNMKINEEIDLSLLRKIISDKYPWTNSESIRLNFAAGKYYKMPSILLKKMKTVILR